DAQRLVTGKEDCGRREFEALGFGRHMRQEDSRSRQTAKQPEVMLWHPNRVETHFLCQYCPVKCLQQELIGRPSGRPVGWRIVSEREVPEAHGRLLVEFWY